MRRQSTVSMKNAREKASNGNKIWSGFSDQPMEECTVCHQRYILSLGKLRSSIKPVKQYQNIIFWSIIVYLLSRSME